MIGEQKPFETVDFHVPRNADDKEKSSTKQKILLRRKEIWAWYSYDVANSVYASLSLTLIGPILLTYLATNHGCKDLIYGCDYNGDAISPEENSSVKFFGLNMKAASYSSFVFSFSVILQGISFILLGPAADYEDYRKKLLLLTATMGSIITIVQSFIGLSDRGWLWVGVLLMISNSLFGLSIIYYNAYLPVLVEYHPEVVGAILQANPNEREIEVVVDDVENRMSAKGFAIGYCTSLFAILIMLVILFVLSGISTEESGVIGKKNWDEEYEVDQRYNLRLVGLRVWSNQRDTIYGLQLQYKDFGWADIIGSDSGIEQESERNNTDYFEKLIVYNSEDNVPSGMSFYRSQNTTVAENFGNTALSQNERTFIPSDQVELGGALVYLDNQRTKVQGLNFYYFNPEGIYDTKGLCFSLLFSGLWWLIGTWAGIGVNLRSFPGKPLPQPYQNLFTVSLKRIYNAICEARKLPNLWKFLISFFLISDGYSTISYTGVLMMVDEFDMGSLEITLMILIVLSSAAAGNIFWCYIQIKYQLTAKSMLLIVVLVLGVTCIWPLWGLNDDFGFGLIDKRELYVFVTLYGSCLGSIQSFARIIMCNLIPVQHESEIFCLYEISDKGSSWVGPLVVGILNEAAEMRYAFVYLVGIFCLAIPLIWSVDVQEGKEQAGRTGKEMVSRKSAGTSV